MSEIIIDISSKFDCVRAEAKGNNVLILRKLDYRIQRFDGKNAGFELEHRWLSAKVETDNDGNWTLVLGSDSTFWQQKEIKNILKNNTKLFEFFQLF
jgi:hypothetical protein